MLKFIIVIIFLSYSHALLAQTEQGPYTITEIIPGVERIEDSNRLNPAGEHPKPFGKYGGLNNTSDMYLIIGKDKALLIDLSNAVTWDSTAMDALRSFVYARKGGRKLYITVTHWHGDHTGMLPAFINDKNIDFWIQTPEFEGRNIFPSDRTRAIAQNQSLDLGGGFQVNALELPGHTEHSTVFFLNGHNLLFTGDAIGSGNGVWIFSYEGFIAYQKSIDNLIKYIDTPVNRVSASDLRIFPGHYWQKREKPTLTMQYIRDMKTLIGKMKTGSAEEIPVNFNRRDLDTNFRFGSATITWKKEHAIRYSNAH